MTQVLGLFLAPRLRKRYKGSIRKVTEMPRTARLPWAKIPHKDRWVCRVCGAKFDFEDEAEDHYMAECGVRYCEGPDCNQRIEPMAKLNMRYCGSRCKQAAYNERVRTAQ